MAWLWPKMALSGCKRLKRDFVPDLAEVCLSPFVLSLNHLIALPGTRYVTQILSEVGTLVYGTKAPSSSFADLAKVVDRLIGRYCSLDHSIMHPLLARHSVCDSNVIRGWYTSLRHLKAPSRSLQIS